MNNMNNFLKNVIFLFFLYFVWINLSYGVQDDDYFDNNNSSYDCEAVWGSCVDYNTYTCWWTTKIWLCPWWTNIKCCIGKYFKKTSSNSSSSSIWYLWFDWFRYWKWSAMQKKFNEKHSTPDILSELCADKDKKITIDFTSVNKDAWKTSLSAEMANTFLNNIWAKIKNGDICSISKSEAGIRTLQSAMRDAKFQEKYCVKKSINIDWFFWPETFRGLAAWSFCKPATPTVAAPTQIITNDKCFVAIVPESFVKDNCNNNPSTCDAWTTSQWWTIKMAKTWDVYRIKWQIHSTDQKTVNATQFKFFIGDKQETNFWSYNDSIITYSSNQVQKNANWFSKNSYKLDFSSSDVLNYKLELKTSSWKTIQCLPWSVGNLKKMEWCGSEFFNNVDWNSDNLNLEKMLDSCEPDSWVITSDKDSTNWWAKDYTLAWWAKERTVKTVNQVISLAFLWTIATTSLAWVNLVTSLGKDDKLKKAKNMLTYSLIWLTTTASAFPLSNAIINTIFKIGN